MDLLFNFLQTWPGQCLIASGGVFLVIVAKGLTRPTSEPFFKIDDLAVGLDLLILAIITSVSAAVSKNIAKNAAISRNLVDAANAARETQVALGFVAAGAALVMFFTAMLIHRAGRLSPKQQGKWMEKQTRRRHAKDPDFEPSDLPPTPEFHLIWGVVVPGILGLLMLLVAIRTAVG